MITFEIMQERDLPSLLDLYKQYYDERELPENFIPDEAKCAAVLSDIRQSDTVYYVAKDGDKVVSTCYISIIPNLTHGGTPIGYIENVITDKDYRRQGLAERVMNMALDYAKSKKCHKVVLLSGSHRSEAHKLYEKLGFDGDAKRGFVIRYTPT